jgi:hypothetical protein
MSMGEMYESQAVDRDMKCSNVRRMIIQHIPRAYSLDALLLTLSAQGSLELLITTRSCQYGILITRGQCHRLAL